MDTGNQVRSVPAGLQIIAAMCDTGEVAKPLVKSGLGIRSGELFDNGRRL